jgi:hypothetical protein
MYTKITNYGAPYNAIFSIFSSFLVLVSIQTIFPSHLRQKYATEK